MKVITYGKDKVYSATCGRCDSDLEYTKEDAFYKEEEVGGIIIEGTYGLFGTKEKTNVDIMKKLCIECPVCKNLITVELLGIDVGYKWEDK